MNSFYSRLYEIKPLIDIEEDDDEENMYLSSKTDLLISISYINNDTTSSRYIPIGSVNYFTDNNNVILIVENKEGQHEFIENAETGIIEWMFFDRNNDMSSIYELISIDVVPIAYEEEVEEELDDEID